MNTLKIKRTLSLFNLKIPVSVRHSASPFPTDGVASNIATIIKIHQMGYTKVTAIKSVCGPRPCVKSEYLVSVVFSVVYFSFFSLCDLVQFFNQSVVCRAVFQINQNCTLTIKIHITLYRCCVFFSR